MRRGAMVLTMLCALAWPMAAQAQQAPDPLYAAAAIQDRHAAEGRGEDQHANPDWIAKTAPQVATYAADGDESILHDPYRANWNGTRGEILNTTFPNRYGARLTASLYRPKGATGALPAIVMVSGWCLQGPTCPTPGWGYEPLLEQIAEAGYVVMKIEPQGQGGSELDPSPKADYCGAHPGAWWRQPQEAGITERFECAGYDDPDVARPGSPTSDAIYDALGPLNATPLGALVTPAFLLDTHIQKATSPKDIPEGIATFYDMFRPRFVFGAIDAARWLKSEANPWRNSVDGGHIGVAGHSAGADGAVVAGNAAPQLFRAAVGWDTYGRPPAAMKPSVPTMMQQSEEESAVGPWIPKPDPELWVSYETAKRFRDAGVPSSVVALRGSTHLEWSYVPYALVNPVAPLTNSSSLGTEVAAYYTVAWFDRFLKPGGQAQRDDAERRLFATTFDDSTDRTSIGQGTWDPVKQANAPYKIAGRNRADLLSRIFRSSMSVGPRTCLDLQAGCGS